MAREEKVWAYAQDAGYTPLEGQCIIVKPAPGDLSDKVLQFFNLSDLCVLQMCESCLILLPFDPTWATLRDETTLVIPYEDIESVNETSDLLNVVIEIKTKTDVIRLTTQQKELSDWRMSGAYATQIIGGIKNWHKENVDATLEALSKLGQSL
ncbi:hypothetical protein AALA21_08470 [Eggerthellaceae bacterium 3-80]|nr:hypothetical protein D7W09_08515 [bacterium D16-34]